MEPNKIESQIKLFINQAVFLDKKRKFIYEGIHLHPSEIHLMLETKGDQAVNATKIAERLGITKGAVSQTLTRLESKGIIEKTKDPYCKNELSITLTPLGKKAYEQHQEMFDEFAKIIKNLSAQYSEKEQEIIKDFLSKITGALTTL